MSTDTSTDPSEPDSTAPTSEHASTAGEAEHAIRLEGLEKYFTENDSFMDRLIPGREIKHVRAVDGVDLTVPRGSTVGLVGESGCGKSTLARAMLRLLEPTAGRVFIDGEDVTAYSSDELRQLRGRAQMIFQDPFSSLNPRYRVRDTLTEPMKVHGIGDSKTDRIERAEKLLDKVGLSADHIDRYPHEFSGGQRQRIAIARALSVEPEVIIADEPVSALDVSVQAQIMNLLEDLQEEMDLTMLFISHDLSVVRQICDRVAVMYLGEIVEEAATDTLYEDPAHPYSEALLSSIPTPDPTVDRDRIPLEGDVPSPIDPPSGCRFHPRCPKVIPPEDWEGDQSGWRRVIQLKHRIETGEVSGSAMAKELHDETDGNVTDEEVVDALIEEHVRAAVVTGIDRVTLPERHESALRSALEQLLDGKRKDAVAHLDEHFPTVCEDVVPELIELKGDRRVSCHLHTDVGPSAREGERALEPEGDR